MTCVPCSIVGWVCSQTTRRDRRARRLLPAAARERLFPSLAVGAVPRLADDIPRKARLFPTASVGRRAYEHEVAVAVVALCSLTGDSRLGYQRCLMRVRLDHHD